MWNPLLPQAILRVLVGMMAKPKVIDLLLICSGRNLASIRVPLVTTFPRGPVDSNAVQVELCADGAMGNAPARQAR